MNLLNYRTFIVHRRKTGDKTIVKVLDSSANFCQILNRLSNWFRAGRKIWVHMQTGAIPVNFFYRCMMKELSVFVDESGNFGMSGEVSSFYVVSFVFHDQLNPIREVLAGLESHLQNIGYPKHYFHTEPIIRGERIYGNMICTRFR